MREEVWHDGVLIETIEHPDPPAAPAPADPLEVLAAVGAALGTITSSSTSAAVRSALLNARAAIDEAIG